MRMMDTEISLAKQGRRPSKRTIVGGLGAWMQMDAGGREGDSAAGTCVECRDLHFHRMAGIGSDP
ncbi:hypothetical protein BTJ49_05555 [Oleiagrimonas sp. MCCC 1A03011]|nr:hypothetical protein BTJ49_05555 [Oleiagrimonas sp. MCCC 1A03011]